MSRIPDGADEEISNPTDNGSFTEILNRRFSRRSILKGAAGAAPLMVLGTSLAACSDDESDQPVAKVQKLGFTPITANLDDKVTVPAGYEAQVVLKWGDPLLEGTSAFKPDAAGIAALTAADQTKRFGYNNDFVAFLPLKDFKAKSSDSGLLSVNHEYTNPELMFPGWDAKNPTKAQVDIELAAHGVSIVEVAKDKGKWGYKVGSPFNRRFTGETEFEMTGPAAGTEKLKVSYDPTGAKARGMLNNCAGGVTPWGTVLTCEENFNQYFSNVNGLPDTDPRKKIHTRYGVTPAASEKGWDKFYDRFEVTKEPNEPFRFGWVVEIDPYDNKWVGKKRTALGRMKHEGATTVIAPDNRVVVYLGDDERFDYMYKFVTANKYNAKDRTANFGLLDSGTLFVAKFSENGSGEWIPVTFGSGQLTAANGFASQADVLVNTRGAADLLGATKMDRPEDIEVNPSNGKVYAIMTNNTNRTPEQTVRANPRGANKHGHIIEITETGSDQAATSFTWDIFILAGDPKVAADAAYYAGFDQTKVSTLSTPDNMMFDAGGNMWIATDGMPSSVKTADGIFAVPVDGEERGYVRAFLTVPVDAECCGPVMTPDNTTLFVAVQHPGEKAGSTYATPSSKWPDGTVPQPAVVAIVKSGGGEGIIGS